MLASNPKFSYLFAVQTKLGYLYTISCLYTTENQPEENILTWPQDLLIGTEFNTDNFVCPLLVILVCVQHLFARLIPCP